MKKARGRIFNFWSISTIILFAFFCITLLYPLARLFINSFISDDGSVTIQNYITFFTKKYYYSALLHSLYIGVISTAVSTVVGTFLAYLMHRYNVAGKSFLKLMFIISLMSPPFIGAYSWIQLLGRNGVITNFMANIGIKMPTIYGKGGIVLVFSLSMSCYVFRYVSAALQGVDSSLEEAAENLGSSKLKRIFRITLPVVVPAITSVMVIVFMRCLADFGTPQLIGEGYKTLPVLVYNAYLGEVGGNAKMAGACSAISVAISLGILLIQKAYIARKNYKMSNLRPPKEVQLRGWKRFLVSLPCFLWVILTMAPQLTVIAISFLKTNGPVFTGQLTLENYIDAFKGCGTSIIHSFLYSTFAVAFIIVLGMLTAYISVRRRKQGGTLLDTLVMFPTVIPGAVIGICYILAFNRRPFMICGTAVVIVLALIIRRLPNTVRSSVGVLEAIDPSLDEASISLGVSPLRTFFKITGRLMLSGVVAGAVLSWISAMNELSSTLLLYGPSTMTMPVSIYTYVMRGNYGIAAALGTIMTITIVITLVAVSKLTKKTGGIL